MISWRCIVNFFILDYKTNDVHECTPLVHWELQNVHVEPMWFGDLLHCRNSYLTCTTAYVQCSSPKIWLSTTWKDQHDICRFRRSIEPSRPPFARKLISNLRTINAEVIKVHVYERMEQEIYNENVHESQSKSLYSCFLCSKQHTWQLRTILKIALMRNSKVNSKKELYILVC